MRVRDVDIFFFKSQFDLFHKFIVKDPTISSGISHPKKNTIELSPCSPRKIIDAGSFNNNWDNIIGVFTRIITLPFLFPSTPSRHSWIGLVLLGTMQLGLVSLFYATAVKHLSAMESALIPIIEPLFNPLWLDERINIMSAVVTGYGRAISEVGAVMVVAGNIPGHARVMTATITMLRNMGEYSLAIATAIVLLLISFVIHSLLYQWQQERYHECTRNRDHKDLQW